MSLSPTCQVSLRPDLRGYVLNPSINRHRISELETWYRKCWACSILIAIWIHSYQKLTLVQGFLLLCSHSYVPESGNSFPMHNHKIFCSFSWFWSVKIRSRNIQTHFADSLVSVLSQEHISFYNKHRLSDSEHLDVIKRWQTTNKHSQKRVSHST